MSYDERKCQEEACDSLRALCPAYCSSSMSFRKEGDCDLHSSRYRPFGEIQKHPCNLRFTNNYYYTGNYITFNSSPYFIETGWGLVLRNWRCMADGGRRMIHSRTCKYVIYLVIYSGSYKRRMAWRIILQKLLPTPASIAVVVTVITHTQFEIFG